MHFKYDRVGPVSSVSNGSYLKGRPLLSLQRIVAVKSKQGGGSDPVPQTIARDILLF